MCLYYNNTIDMKDKDYFDIWNHSSGEDISKSEIRYSYSKVVKRIDRIECRNRNRVYSRKLRKVFLYSLGTAAAIVTIAFLSISVYNTYSPSEALTVAEPIEYLEVRSGLGETKNVTLPDSTKITLNSGSLIIYPDKFAGLKRSVYHSGEAIFDVTHDEQKPFEVSTADFVVKVHGTKFNVSAYSDDLEGTTTLCRGSVSITSRITAKEYYILPNQRLSMSKEGVVKVSDILSEEETAWASNALCFNSAAFRDMLRSIERRFGVKIYLTTNKYDDSLITAKFMCGASIREMMAALSKIVPGMKWQENHEGDILIK